MLLLSNYIYIVNVTNILINIIRFYEWLHIHIHFNFIFLRRCNSYSKCVCLSCYIVLSRQMKIGLCGLHCRLAQ